MLVVINAYMYIESIVHKDVGAALAVTRQFGILVKLTHTFPQPMSMHE